MMTWRNRLILLSLTGLLCACSSAAAIPVSTPTPPPLATELIFYDWEGDMPQAVLDAFTQEYGVKVTYQVYESEEDVVNNLEAGQVYDVAVVENRYLPRLSAAGRLAEIDPRHVPNMKNISANFRDLVYDPGNRYSVPFNWGTTALVVRTDLVKEPITHWSALWDPRYRGHTALWIGQPREVLGLTLKSLGYSANSDRPAELEAALNRLLELKSDLITIEDYDLDTSAGLLVSGQAIVVMGYADDVRAAREQNPAVQYVLPVEGALLWGDNFVIPAASPRKATAGAFLNFILRPAISAQIINANHYPLPNDLADPLIDPSVRNDPAVYPPDRDLNNAEIILPLKPEIQKLYDDIWTRFLATSP